VVLGTVGIPVTLVTFTLIGVYLKRLVHFSLFHVGYGSFSFHSDIVFDRFDRFWTGSCAFSQVLRQLDMRVTQ